MPSQPFASSPTSGTSVEVSGERAYYSVAQAAALLGVSRVTVWRWVRSGRLPVWRLGHRTVRIKREDLEQFLGGAGRQDAPDATCSIRGRSERSERVPGEHRVQFYESDAYLLEVVHALLTPGLQAGGAAVLVATQAHRAALEARWRAEGLDLVALVQGGRYVALDAAETLARLRVGTRLDPERFAAVIEPVIARAAAGGRRVYVFGEMVALLAREGNYPAAVQLEGLWNAWQQTHPFTLLCGYPIDAFGEAALAELFDDVCAEHARVIPTERYAALARADDQLRAIAELEQRARALETEIAARQRVEEQLAAALAVARRRERELRDYAETRARLAAIVESADDAILTKTLDGIITSWNPGAERLYGYTAVEMIGQSVARLIPPDRPAELPRIVERLRRGERIAHYETVHVCKDGRRVDVSVSISPIRDAAGAVVGASAIARDITASKQQQEALRFNEERLRLALAAGRMGTWDWTPETGRVVWSSSLETLYGYAPGTFGGTFEAFVQGIHPADRERVVQAVAHALASEAPYHIEYRGIGPDGRLRWFEGHGAVLRDAQGRPMRMLGVCSDVTERKQTEEVLREERESLATLNRLGQVIAAELDLEKLVQAVTDAGRELAGAQVGAFFATPRDERGERYQLVTLPGTAHEFGPMCWGEGIVRLDDVRRDPRFGRDSPAEGLPPGHRPVASYLAVPVVSRSGEVLGRLVFGHPEPGVFTERAERLVAGLAAIAAVAMDNARLYRQVQEAVRARDEFVNAAAHDLKTPLTTIKGTAQFLQRQALRTGAAGSERLLEGLARIDATATEIAEQLDELLDLTRLELGQPLGLHHAPTDLVALARRIAAAQQETTERHRIRVEATLPALEGLWDAVRLARVIENLVSNAIKYSPAGGDVVVTVAQDAAGWAVLTVRDQGLGIPAADLPRIFGRFERGGNVAGRIGGTGIGLASARQIVEQHGGTITVEAQEGVGSTFTVRLPLEPSGSQACSRRAPIAGDHARRGVY